MTKKQAYIIMTLLAYVLLRLGRPENGSGGTGPNGAIQSALIHRNHIGMLYAVLFQSFQDDRTNFLSKLLQHVDGKLQGNAALCPGLQHNQNIAGLCGPSCALDLQLHLQAPLPCLFQAAADGGDELPTGDRLSSGGIIHQIHQILGHHTGV